MNKMVEDDPVETAGKVRVGQLLVGLLVTVVVGLCVWWDFQTSASLRIGGLCWGMAITIVALLVSASALPIVRAWIARVLIRSVPGIVFLFGIFLAGVGVRYLMAADWVRGDLGMLMFLVALVVDGLLIAGVVAWVKVKPFLRNRMSVRSPFSNCRLDRKIDSALINGALAFSCALGVWFALIHMIAAVCWNDRADSLLICILCVLFGLVFFGHFVTAVSLPLFRFSLTCDEWRPGARVMIDYLQVGKGRVGPFRVKLDQFAGKEMVVRQVYETESVDHIGSFTFVIPDEFKPVQSSWELHLAYYVDGSFMKRQSDYVIPV